MTYRIAPGSQLDTALNVLAAAELGEHPDPGALLAAGDLVTATGARWAVMALGLRVWTAGHGAVMPGGDRLPADELEARWYGGPAVAA